MDPKERTYITTCLPCRETLFKIYKHIYTYTPHLMLLLQVTWSSQLAYASSVPVRINKNYFLVQSFDILVLILFIFLTVAIISSPQKNYQLFRNPRFKNAGKYLKLSEFLNLAKNASSLSGVLISIEVRILSKVSLPCL